MTLLAIPGPVDPHVHLRDLEWSHKATVESETAAALAGGYWAVLDMPNTPPATTTHPRLADKAERVAGSARCDVGLYLGADQAGNEAEYPDSAAAAVGLKMYCDATTGDLLIAEDEQRRRHMQAWVASSSKPLAVHAEGETLARILGLARETGARVHFCHVSAASEIERLREAKQAGAAISVGVTPHHLYLTETDVADRGGYGQVRPGLKTRADVDALWEGISDGTVDVVESDHAPHARDEKDSATPPPGFPGLETTLPLLVLALHDGRISEERLIELVATSAQRIFDVHPPQGTRTLIDASASYVVDDDRLRTAPGWSPFSGMRVWGDVREVRIGGRVAYDGETVRAAPGSGRALLWS